MNDAQFNEQGDRHSAGPLMLMAVLVVAANLRMTITGVGPLLDQIGSEESISPALLGLLSALPLIFWGLFSPTAHWLSSRLGMSSAMTWSLVVLTAGTLWRSLPGNDLNLWFGTALMGCGLAVSNALMPAVIKRDFASSVPLIMAIYTALLGGMGAVGAGLAVPLAQLQLSPGEPAGWRFALAALGAPLIIATLAWIIANRRTHQSKQATTSDVHVSQGSAGRRVWGDSLAWQVSLFMGTQSAIFYSVSSWLAPFRIDSGVAPVSAGAELMFFQGFGIAGSLALPFLARDARVRRWMPAILPFVGVIAWIGIPFAPDLMPLWLVIAGVAGGGSLTVAMTLMATRARTSEHATALSGMAQAVGYGFAALGPLSFGILLGATGTWIASWALVWCAAAAQIVLGISVGRPRFILER